MNNDQLDQIAKMLRAQLKSAGHVWWIGGYIYGQTSNGDVFVILYPAAENLKEKIVRVYDNDLKKLPAFIPTDVDGGDTEANPNKDQARKKGIYHECPPFEIVTCDGKDTQMGKERRFGDVLRLSRAAAEALRNVGAPTPAARQASFSPLPPLPEEFEPRPATQAIIPGAGPVLPDFRAMAEGAQTAAEFDYAAFMTLQNGLYTDQERITKTREVLVLGWRPGGAANAAMLAALTVYRDKRHAAEERGEATAAAHQFAKREAMATYNRTIGS